MVQAIVRRETLTPVVDGPSRRAVAGIVINVAPDGGRNNDKKAESKYQMRTHFLDKN